MILDWDTVLRFGSAVAWLTMLARLIRHRRELNGTGVRRIVVTACLGLLLAVIAIGPSLVPLVGGSAVKELYTATATALLLVGVAFVASPV